MFVRFVDLTAVSMRQSLSAQFLQSHFVRTALLNLPKRPAHSQTPSARVNIRTTSIDYPMSTSGSQDRTYRPRTLSDLAHSHQFPRLTSRLRHPEPLTYAGLGPCLSSDVRASVPYLFRIITRHLDNYHKANMTRTMIVGFDSTYR